MGFEEIDGDDDFQEEFACPFCAESYDIIALCCHIDDEHNLESKNAVLSLSLSLCNTFYTNWKFINNPLFFFFFFAGMPCLLSKSGNWYRSAHYTSSWEFIQDILFTIIVFLILPNFLYIFFVEFLNEFLHAAKEEITKNWFTFSSSERAKRRRSTKVVRNFFSHWFYYCI